MKIFSPAKINLFLDVLNKRDDGYHNVNMILQTVSLHDVIDINLSNSSDIIINCNKKIDCDIKNNICYKISKKFFEYTGINNKSVNINIEKNIPIASGLAGGSSNGAATLIGLNKLFNSNLDKKTLWKICSEIGSDIPFFIDGGTAIATNTGTTLKKLNSLNDMIILICTPPIAISTKYAYNLIDKYTDSHISQFYRIQKYINSHDIKNIATNMYNIFEKALNIDKIYHIKKTMLQNNVLNTCLSGTGSSIFGIFENIDYAKKCHFILKQHYQNCFLCKTINYGVKALYIN